MNLLLLVSVSVGNVVLSLGCIRGRLVARQRLIWVPGMLGNWGPVYWLQLSYITLCDVQSRLEHMYVCILV